MSLKHICHSVTHTISHSILSVALSPYTFGRSVTLSLKLCVALSLEVTRRLFADTAQRPAPRRRQRRCEMVGGGGGVGGAVHKPGAVAQPEGDGGVDSGRLDGEGICER